MHGFSPSPLMGKCSDFFSLSRSLGGNLSKIEFDSQGQEQRQSKMEPCSHSYLCIPFSNVLPIAATDLNILLLPALARKLTGAAAIICRSKLKGKRDCSESTVGGGERR